DSVDKHTITSTVRIQGDQVSLYARELARELLQLEFDDDRLTELQGELFAWNGDMSRDSAAPLLIAAWQREFLPLAFGDLLGDLFTEWAGNRPVLVLQALRGESLFCTECRSEAVTAFSRA